MRVAVTGAAGFLGSHLCERLLGAGHDVVGIDAFTRFYARSLKERNLSELRGARRFELHERNLLAGGLEPLLRGAGAVCHFAGRPGVRTDSIALLEAGNVATTEHVLRAAAGSGVRRVVLASSSSVYGASSRPLREVDPLRPLSAYGRSKLRAEQAATQLAARLGIELVTLRFFTVYGPRQRPDMAFARYLEAAASRRPMALFGDGGQRRDFTFVGDAAAAAVAALERAPAGAVLNVSGGAPVALADALALLAGFGTRAPLLRRCADPREPRATAADLTRIGATLGWRPRVALEVGLRLQSERGARLAA